MGQYNKNRLHTGGETCPDESGAIHHLLLEWILNVMSKVHRGASAHCMLTSERALPFFTLKQMHVRMLEEKI